PLISLPVQFERVGVTRKEKKAVLDWAVSEDATVEKYIVERSADAVHFSLSGEVAAKKGQATSGYTWADESPIKGVNYYRLQMVQSNGKTTFSKTVSVQFEQGNASVVVFPNPVVDGSVNLRFDGVKDGLYTMTLYNKQGQALEKKVLTHTGNSAAYTFKPLFSLPAGVYYLTITSDAFLSRKEIIIQK
ncbi:MAG: T9SS type A sorting domain-containing protein, partial [Bacteroidota bacterium]|nr:T9SS type A sorting domain-containing protein [Bacteroidota bacterium]